MSPYHCILFANLQARRMSSQIYLVFTFFLLVTPHMVLNQGRSFSATQGQSNALTSSSKNCPTNTTPNKRVVCFYRIEDEFRPYDLDPCLCTHIVYSYVAVKENFAFIAGKKGDLKYLSALRNRNPAVKIIVSLRPTGLKFTLEDPKNITYPLPPSNTLRHRFAKRIRDFLTRHELDGVDIDYEYFKQEDHSNNRKRDYLIAIVQSIASSIKQSNDPIKPLLTLTTSRYPRHLADYYDFSEVYKHVDFVNIPAFNFDQEGKNLIHPAKLHGISEMENMDAIMDLALALGLPSRMLVVGVPTFGTLYRLTNLSQTTPGSASISWQSNNEPITTISHSKICDVRQKANWTLVREKDLTAPYIYLHDKWIGFDDEISITLKAKYVVLRQAGGIAFFHLNDDDPNGQCGLGRYPLLQSALSVFLKPPEQINNVAQTDTPLLSNFSQQYFSSFVNIVSKHGNIERVVDDDDEENTLQTLPCKHDGYQRHPEDCTRFYRCLKFDKTDKETQKLQYTCPAGLVFDESYQICNWPSWTPSCIGSGEIEPSGKQSFVCSKQGFFQDSDNCEYFHYCSDLGKTFLQPYQFKCPFELGFDEEKLQCNWKWLVKGCEYIPPEERIVRDLQQILPQPTNTEEGEIEPAASEQLPQFEHLPDDEEAVFENASAEDEFEKRSDNYDEPLQRGFLQNYQEKFSPMQLAKLYQLARPNSDSSQPNAFSSRIQVLTNYMSQLVTRVRKTLWPASTLESRSDRPNSASWFMPFNHLIPKFKPFRKPKLMTPKMSKVSKMKKTKNSEKTGRDKTRFKVPKLPKFGKKSNAENGKANAKLTTNSKGIPTRFTSLTSDMVPMFVEETVQMPQMVKPPKNFVMPTLFANKKPSYERFVKAESSLHPVVTKVTTHNHFNSGPSPMTTKKLSATQGHMKVNLMNDYQVAGSFAINTFGEQSQSTLPRETFQFVPTKSPSISYYFPSSNKPVSNLSKPKATPTTTRPKSGSLNIGSKPQAAANPFGDTFRPYHHSYGLPSVNIRYSYSDNNNKFPVKPKPTSQLPQQPAKPKLPNNKVQIETTRFNFPETVIGGDANSADAQLASFLRDKFIINKNPNQNTNPNLNSKPKPKPKPVNVETLDQLQANAFRPPTTSTSGVKPKVPSRVPVRQQVNLHPQSVPPSMNHFSAKPVVNVTPAKPKFVIPPPKMTKPSFSSMLPATDPFAMEREKFFGSIPTVNVAKPAAINYKLTPITESVFELSNQSLVTNKELPKSHLLEPVAPVQPQRDPVTQAVHKASRFEYIRSTQRPSIKYDSYEWTTPTSLKHDKINVNFNVMTPKDINEEINNRKKYLFPDNPAYKPLDTPIPVNKPNIFPAMGDLFEQFQRNKENLRTNSQSALNSFLGSKFTTEATPEIVESEPISTAPENDLISTTVAPLWSSQPVDITKLMNNDTNEYIMLMLNNQLGTSDEKILSQHLNDLLDGGKQIAKVYNVESNGANTLLALLPKYTTDGEQKQRPFVYKGESSLLKNISDHSISHQNDDSVLKLSIPKSDSEILNSIFNKVKDELSNADQLLPTAEELGGMLHGQLHHSQRLNLPNSNVFNPWVASSTTKPPPPAPSTGNIFNNYQQTSSTSQPWYEHVHSTPAPVPDTVYEFQGENMSNLQKLNRSSNAWYEDVSKDRLNNRPHSYDSDRNSQEEPALDYDTTRASLPPATSTTRFSTTRFSTTTISTTRRPTTTSTTTTTTTTTTTPEPPSTKKPIRPKRPQLRRKPEFGSRQQANQRPSVSEENELTVTSDRTPPQEKPSNFKVGNKEDKVRPKITAGVDYANQNNFGQRQPVPGSNEGKELESYAEVSSTEKPMFYEEELPDFTELNYPETQNNHHPHGGNRRIIATSTTPRPLENAAVNSYYPDSTIHNLKADKNGIPESACTRPGIFQHPNDCNRYYECYWDKHINKFTLQPFECPVKLAFDSRIIGCGSPNDPTVCVQY